MRASRSCGSTSAPHLVILSTSLVHAALLSRCCTMMRASWHSVQAVVALACTGPAGNSGLEADWAHARVDTKATTNRETATLSLYMDLHLIDGVVQITAGIPNGSRGLRAALAIGGTGDDGVVSGLWRLPRIAEQSPCIVSVLFAKFRGMPGVPAVSGDVDTGHVAFPCPGHTLNVQVGRSRSGTILRTGNQRLDIECGHRMSVFGFDRLAGLHRLVRHAIARAHEVAFEFLFEDLDFGEPFTGGCADPARR